MSKRTGVYLRFQAKVHDPGVLRSTLAGSTMSLRISANGGGIRMAKKIYVVAVLPTEGVGL